MTSAYDEKHDSGSSEQRHNGTARGGTQPLRNMRRGCGLIFLLLALSLLIATLLVPQHKAYCGTAAVIALFCAVVFFTHTRAGTLAVALSVILVDAVLWVSAYAVVPAAQKRYDDCLEKAWASGAVTDKAVYDQYYGSGADPFDERWASNDAAIERCYQKAHAPSMQLRLGLLGFAFILGCILGLYIIIVTIVSITCHCRKQQSDIDAAPEAGTVVIDIKEAFDRKMDLASTPAPEETKAHHPLSKV